MNNVTLIGRLTKDPELRYLQGGNSGAVARVTIAVDKQLSKEKKAEMESKNQPTADFINIVVWGKLGENAAKFTQKGKRVAITGRIQSGSYKAQDGSTRYTTEVVASNVEFIDWKDSSTNDNYNNSEDENTNNNFNGDFDFNSDFDPTNDDGRIPF